MSFVPNPVQVAALCYFEDIDPEYGSLQVIPGSHRREISEADAAIVTLPPRAGDVVVIDYRVLHGTTANATTMQRECVLLSFTPSWSALPNDLRSHLISHLALPLAEEVIPESLGHSPLLPTFDGPRKDLGLNWFPPPNFVVSHPETCGGLTLSG